MGNSVKSPNAPADGAVLQQIALNARTSSQLLTRFKLKLSLTNLYKLGTKINATNNI